MNRSILTPVALCALTLGINLPARADVSDDQMEMIYNKMRSILGKGLDDKSKLILAMPGFPLNPNDLDPKNEEGPKVIAQFLDNIPKALPAYTRNGEWSYSRVYNSIMDNKSVSLPPVTPEEQATFDAAIQKASDLKKRFKKLWNNYQGAKAAWLEAYRINKKSSDTVTNKAAMDDAEDELKLDKDYGEYLKAVSQIESFNAKNPAVFWFNAKQQFRDGAQDGYYSLAYFPSPDQWMVDDGWAGFTCKVSKKSSGSSSSSTGWNAAMKANVGKLSASANASGKSTQLESFLSGSDVTMTFQAKRINVARPWLNPEVLSRDGWDMPVEMNIKLFSYGNFEQNNANNVPWPIYVHTLFLIKDLEISADLTDEQKSAITSAISASASATYGPVTVSGGYSNDSAKEKATAQVSSTGIKVTGVQVLGFVGNCTAPFPYKTAKTMGLITQ